MYLQMFLKVNKDCAEVTSRGNCRSRLEVQPRRRLERRLFLVWSVGRPVCDSTQVVGASVSHHRPATVKSLARYSGAELLYIKILQYVTYVFEIPGTTATNKLV